MFKGDNRDKNIYQLDPWHRFVWINRANGIFLCKSGNNLIPL